MPISASGEVALPTITMDPGQDMPVIIVPSGSKPARRLMPDGLSGTVWGPVGFVGDDLLVDSRAGQRHELLLLDTVTGARRSTTKIGAGIWSYAVVGMAEMVVIT